MNYKVSEHTEINKKFAVYEIASNGERCKIMAWCRDEKDANLIASMLNDRAACKDNT